MALTLKYEKHQQKLGFDWRKLTNGINWEETHSDVNLERAEPKSLGRWFSWENTCGITKIHIPSTHVKKEQEQKLGAAMDLESQSWEERVRENPCVAGQPAELTQWAPGWMRDSVSKNK